MHKPKNFYLWLVSLSLILPLTELVIFSIIYESLSEMVIGISASYLPISIISGEFLLYLMMNTRNKSAKKYVFLGYVISVFVTILISVIFQSLPTWVVSNIIGGLILLGGTFLAYLTKPKTTVFYI